MVESGINLRSSCIYNGTYQTFCSAGAVVVSSESDVAAEVVVVCAGLLAVVVVTITSGSTAFARSKRCSLRRSE